VSILAADQVEQGQWFSYPGRRFGRDAPEWLQRDDATGAWVVPGCIAWLGCEVLEVLRPATALDHDLVLARVVATGEGRLGEPALLYSSRQGWRSLGGKVREGVGATRDRLLAREAGRPPA
jgi:flavin reductase (DIM6/NTAB) family NADH-FMN oxidoreductase RutF